MSATTPNGPEPMLSIPLDTVCFIIGKLREYDSLEILDDEPKDEPASPLECEDVDVLRDRENEYAYEPVLQELVSFIGDLPEDQQVDLVALMWLGRDSYSHADWSTVREEAAQAHNARTAHYLLGSPMAADFLEEGLATLGFSCESDATENP